MALKLANCKNMYGELLNHVATNSIPAQPVFKPGACDMDCVLSAKQVLLLFGFIIRHLPSI